MEDNSLNRLLASTILADYGAIIAEAENGEEAVELARSEDFDIVLMDIQMPVMDGNRAAHIIRNELKKTMPIIALTANVIRGVEAGFAESGMNDFIVKPYTEENLVNPIAKWVDKSLNGQTKNMDNKQEIPTGKVADQTTNEAEKPEENINPQPLYDLSKLLAIARNDNGFIIKMLQLFISETGQGLVKLNEAYESGDLKTVKYYAHRMKPSISNLGIDSIKDEVFELEMMEEKSPAMRPKLGKVNKVLAAVTEQLKTEFKL